MPSHTDCNHQLQNWITVSLARLLSLWKTVTYIRSFTGIITLWTDQSDKPECAGKHVKDFLTLQFSLQFFSCPCLLLLFMSNNDIILWNFTNPLSSFCYVQEHLKVLVEKRSIYCTVNLQHMIQLRTHIIRYFISCSQYQSAMSEKLLPRNCKTLTNGGGVCVFQQSTKLNWR